MIDWSDISCLILKGALVTVELTLMGCALALVMAFIAGARPVVAHFAFRALATAYIEFFRAPPSSCSCSGPISCCRCSVFR